MDNFAAEIGTIAAAITRRDAEARASFKRPLPVEVSRSEQRLEGLQHQFKMWCANQLHAAVRQADLLLAQAHWRMEQTMAPLPGSRCLDLSPETVVAQTTIALWREGNRHLLTATMHGDGMVRAVDSASAGDTPAELYPNGTAQTLDAGYARTLILKFSDRATGLPFGKLPAEVAHPR